MIEYRSWKAIFVTATFWAWLTGDALDSRLQVCADALFVKDVCTTLLQSLSKILLENSHGDWAFGSKHGRALFPCPTAGVTGWESTTGSEGIQQSCLHSTFIVLMVVFANTSNYYLFVSLVQLTNIRNMDFLITKRVAIKHEKHPLYFKYLKLLWHLKDEKR